MTPETQHVLSVLKHAIRAAGLKNRDVERELGMGSSYLSRLFAGTIELRCEHVFRIARVAGLAPFEILHALYPAPKDPPSEAMVRLRELLRHLKPPPPPSPDWPRELEEAFEIRLEQTLWESLRRLRLSLAPLGVGGAEEER
jgi:transcriptional regulator with XRE-family HTH domain